MLQWKSDSDMTFRLVERKWEEEFNLALSDDASELRIICPFIKEKPIQMLLGHQPKDVKVITRFNLADCADGVSDVAALRRLLEAGAKVRGVRNLHAKLYIFGKTSAIITSCNLTAAALRQNRELGIVTTNGPFIEKCLVFFDELWSQAGENLVRDQVAAWDQAVKNYWLGGGWQPEREGLTDFGVSAGTVEAPSQEANETPPPEAKSIALLDPKAFVKFLGSGTNRSDHSDSTREVIEWEGCHRAVCYSKPSRQVNDNDIIFMGRLTRDPKDIRIFGQAIGTAYEEGRDDASEAEIGKQDWRKKYSRYIRVHHAQFVEGTIGNGVSLNALMQEFNADSFASTKKNKEIGSGNMNPRRAYSQKTQVELSPEGFSWLSNRLQEAFDNHGRVPHEVLENLDWPHTSGNSTLQT